MQILLNVSATTFRIMNIPKGKPNKTGGAITAKRDRLVDENSPRKEVCNASYVGLYHSNLCHCSLELALCQPLVVPKECNWRTRDRSNRVKQPNTHSKWDARCTFAPSPVFLVHQLGEGIRGRINR
jgi:hypothetical protein